ncbi:MAG: hypothetical protein ACRD4O_18465, partial [Bryobacteraceae bacterium]
MSPNKPLPGTRPLLLFGAVEAFFRTIYGWAEEAGAPSEPMDPETRAEPDDLDVKLIWRIGVGLLLVLWALVVVIYPFFNFLKFDRTGGLEPSKVLAYIPKLPPKPRNEHLPFLVLQKFRAGEKADLGSYRWVDRKNGVVSIPIARAMQILAQHGIPPSQP